MPAPHRRQAALAVRCPTSDPAGRERRRKLIGSQAHTLQDQCGKEFDVGFEITPRLYFFENFQNDLFHTNRQIVQCSGAAAIGPFSRHSA
ncbi:hypothetical protein ANAEL_03216 [Anaerolineales bacterium]|nr:hypothetical protein ANAEL_03216 [Anaerolineales bacterium]